MERVQRGIASRQPLPYPAALQLEDICVHVPGAGKVRGG